MHDYAHVRAMVRRLHHLTEAGEWSAVEAEAWRIADALAEDAASARLEAHVTRVAAALDVVPRSRNVVTARTGLHHRDVARALAACVARGLAIATSRGDREAYAKYA